MNKFIETEDRMVVARGWRSGEWELLFNEGRVSVWEDEKFWRWMMVVVGQRCECTQCH